MGVSHLNVPLLLLKKITGVIVENDFLNPFLLLEIHQKPERAPAMEVPSDLVEPLFQLVVMDKAGQRRWAITSLITLYKLNLLDAVQSQKLAEALWRKTDQFSLPDGTDFHKFAFLSLPHPKNVDPTYLFKILYQ